MLEAPDSAPPAEAMHELPVVDNQTDMPPEVFHELVRRFEASKRGSPERNFGVETMDQGGKRYKYDAYADQEARGYPRDRTADSVGNFFQRLGQNFGRNGEQVRSDQADKYRTDAALRLREKELGADETYRQAMLENQNRTREAAHRTALVGIESRAYGRATSAWRASQPKVRSTAQESLDTERAALERARADALRGGRTEKGGIPGGRPKPDFTPDQAFTNMRQAEEEGRAIERELGQVDTFKPETHWFKPDDVDLHLKDKYGRSYQTVPADQIQDYRKKLILDRDYYAAQVAKFRELARNGNQPPAEDEGGDASTEEEADIEPDQDPDDPGGWEGASKVPAGGEATEPAASPSSSGKIPIPGLGRKPTPSPEAFAKLPYREQLYHQFAKENPEASDMELKMAVIRHIAIQTKPRGGVPAAAGGSR
jgi:hypothetical protein